MQAVHLSADANAVAMRSENVSTQSDEKRHQREGDLVHLVLSSRRVLSLGGVEVSYAIVIRGVFSESLLGAVTVAAENAGLLDNASR